MAIKPRYLVIVILAVFILGIIVVYSNTKTEVASTQTSAGGAYCANVEYTLCDEFDAAGIDSSKWNPIDPANQWVQRGDGTMFGMPKAVTVPEFSNFTYEAKLNLGFRSDLVFRYKDLNNYYSFQVISAGTEGAYYGRIVPAVKYNGTTVAAEPVWNDRVAINMGSWYTLKVVAQGNKFDFYIDGKLLGSWRDPNNYFASGYIGFYPEKLQETIYDYVRIQEVTVNPGSQDLPGKILDLLSGGAGKSGKVPKGIQYAPGLQNASNDKTPPALGNIKADVIDATLTSISWETDEESTSVVVFGSSPNEYTAIIRGAAEKSENKYNHRVGLPPLEPNAKYYYKVYSADPTGNASMSEEQELVF